MTKLITMLCLIFVIFNSSRSEALSLWVIHPTKHCLSPTVSTVQEVYAPDHEEPVICGSFKNSFYAVNVDHRKVNDVPPFRGSGFHKPAFHFQRVSMRAEFEWLPIRGVCSSKQDNVSICLRIGISYPHKLGFASASVDRVDAAKHWPRAIKDRLEVQTSLENLDHWRVCSDEILPQEIGGFGGLGKGFPDKNDTHSSYNNRRESNVEHQLGLPGHGLLGNQVSYFIFAGVLAGMSALLGYQIADRGLNAFYRGQKMSGFIQFWFGILMCCGLTFLVMAAMFRLIFFLWFRWLL